MSFTLLLLCCTGVSKISFSYQRELSHGKKPSIYISIDSTAYRSISSELINRNGVRIGYIVLFDDQSFKGPIYFDQAKYNIYDFYKKSESVYERKDNWGRYLINGNNIGIEIGLCEYTPWCRFRLKTTAVKIINDSTLYVDPAVLDNAILFGKNASLFHRIDSVDLSFIKPSNAWLNR